MNDNCLKGTILLVRLSETTFMVHANCVLCSQSGMFSLLARDLTSSPFQAFSPPYIVDLSKSRKTRIATVGGDLGVLTFTPSQDEGVGKPRKHRLAAIVTACVGAAMFVAVAVTIVYFCLMRAKRYARRTSETESSEPSPRVDRARVNVSTQSDAHEIQNLRQITITELELSTSNFSDTNIIGEGGFGLVYKGLLRDGSIVAIKRRLHEPSQHFIQEVENIGRIHHKHIVKLIGYCQESHQQLLVYDYLPNGNVGNHLYDNVGSPIGKLTIHQRLSIALGAARGLEYLHSLAPPLLHMHFKTSNVLVDDNFTAKVADFGLSKLLIRSTLAESSSGIEDFIDPELNMSSTFSERNDVYSYGVFLLELISRHEILNGNQSEPLQNLVEKAKNTPCDLAGFGDKRVESDAKDALQWLMELALQCIDTGVRRPVMKTVVKELELIQERETGHQQAACSGEEISVVTLGSELFK